MVDVQPPLTIASAVILDERGASCDNTHIFKFLDAAFDRIDILTEHLAELLVGKVTLTAIPLELLNMRHNQQVKAPESSAEISLVDG